MKALFAPALLSQQEVFAFLMNDALGQPLLHKDDALSFGKRCDNGLAKAKKVKAVAMVKAKATAKAQAKAKRAADANLELIAKAATAGAAELKAALDDTYDVKPPRATVGAKRKVPEPLTVQQEFVESQAHDETLITAVEAAIREYDELVKVYGTESDEGFELITTHRRADTANFGHALVLAAERRWEARAEELEAYAPVHSAKKVRWSAWILAEVENSRKFAADTQALLAMAAEMWESHGYESS